MQAAEKMDRICARLEISLRISWQMGLSVSTAQNSTKVPHLHPYKTVVVHECYDTGWEARLSFVSWYLQVVHAGQIDPTLILLSKHAVRVTGTGLQKTGC